MLRCKINGVDNKYECTPKGVTKVVQACYSNGQFEPPLYKSVLLLGSKRWKDHVVLGDVKF